jgi:hypothetical protein
LTITQHAAGQEVMRWVLEIRSTITVIDSLPVLVITAGPFYAADFGSDDVVGTIISSYEAVAGASFLDSKGGYRRYVLMHGTNLRRRELQSHQKDNEAWRDAQQPATRRSGFHFVGGIEEAS